MTKDYIKRQFSNFYNEVIKGKIPIDAINELLTSDYVETSFEVVSKEYVSSRGVITQIQGEQWKRSTPIAVTRGQQIRFHASGMATNVAMISTCNSDGTNIVPKVISVSGDNDYYNLRDYEYTVISDGYIMISCNEMGGTPILYIKDSSGIEQMNLKINTVNAKPINNQLCHILKKVVCIGDSYTKGYISDGSISLTDKPEYSWVEHLAKITGNTWINRGISGATADTWLSNADGYAKAVTDGKSQAYVIGLGINDSREENSTRLLALGTINDIGTEAVSYYGRMSKIITQLAEISPNAIFFVNTCPLWYAFDRVTDYNTAIRDIVEHYKNTYNIHCIDLADTYHDLYFDREFTSDFIGNHPTVIGHAKMAKMYEYVLSDYMSKHLDDFNSVPWIEYDA